MRHAMMIIVHAMMSKLFPLSHPVTVEHCAVYCPVMAPLEHLVTDLQKSLSSWKNGHNPFHLLTCWPALTGVKPADPARWPAAAGMLWTPDKYSFKNPVCDFCIKFLCHDLCIRYFGEFMYSKSMFSLIDLLFNKWDFVNDALMRFRDSIKHLLLNAHTERS